jgi:N-acyl-D-amino-acid deacylase
MPKHLAPVIAALLAVARLVAADEPLYTEHETRSAIERAIPLIESGSAGSAEQRTCFTCHNQALPVLALTEAQRQGFVIDEANLRRQLEHTLAHLERGKTNYLEGKGQGGKSVTAGYALWALKAGGHAADETTAAVTHYLLQEQRQAGRWSHPGTRPPSSGSDFTTTSVALRSLAAYGTAEQQPEIKSRIATVREWLVKTVPRDTEDPVFLLHALRSTEAGDDLLQQAAATLLCNQRDDGGWAQTDEMESDAYATGTVLVALVQANTLTIDNEQLQRGFKFLLDAQLDDGSWHVKTRAKPFQTYYESGFPHDKDQFISIAASSWATLALVLSLRESRDQ